MDLLPYTSLTVPIRAQASTDPWRVLGALRPYRSLKGLKGPMKRNMKLETGTQIYVT